MRDGLLSTVVKAQTADRTKRHNSFLRIFDTPLYKDWLFWLAVAFAIVTVQNVVADYTILEGPFFSEKKFNIDGRQLAFVIDLVVIYALTFSLFVAVPGGIRKAIRERRSGHNSAA
jgi:hypothetical protein